MNTPTLSLEDAAKLIVDRNIGKTAETLTVHDFVDFIDSFYEDLTGRSGSEFNLKSPPNEVYNLLEKFNITYNDFTKEWQRVIGS